ncbi:MAG: hypothetical protein WCP21_09155 [Armatimonadota bacterium]
MTSKQFRMLVVVTLVAGFLGGAVCNLLLRGTPATAQGAPNTVRATTFVVVDDAGKTRATLGVVGSSFCPALTLYDATGKRRAGLSMGPDGSPGLSTYDANSVLRARVGCLQTVSTSTGTKTNYPESTVAVFKKDGTISWRTP